MQADLTMMDQALHDFEDVDIKYLFLATAQRVRPNRGGAIYSRDPRTNKFVYGWHGTEDGNAMMRAR